MSVPHLGGGHYRSYDAILCYNRNNVKDAQARFGYRDGRGEF